jgi:hypothetical protein
MVQLDLDLEGSGIPELRTGVEPGKTVRSL